MQYVIEKWGERPHYSGTVRCLGADEHGTWVWGAPGRTIYRGAEPVFQAQQAMISVIIDGAWWTPSWWLGHPELELYVNINTPVVSEPDRYLTIDLDLDVIRSVEGEVSIIDWDDLALHRDLYDYPPDLVDRAVAAAEAAEKLVVDNVPPFDGAAARAWAARAW